MKSISRNDQINKALHREAQKLENYDKIKKYEENAEKDPVYICID